MNAPDPPHHAGPVSRTIAYLIDVFVVAGLFIGGVVVAGVIASFIGSRARDLVATVAAAYLLALPGLLVVYCAVFWALAGRTPGMALLGLRVVRTRRRTVSWWSALLRALVVTFFPIGALWALVDRRHQAVHDKLAGTTVVRVPSPVPAPSVVR